ncbi:iron chaperone [Guptibacillus algicola]|uniref:iron chaperone n=1 Tax=Guptibacillus algicola TaxID=225844 RepID=UPI001CD70C68|nr:iron chaperone [Alkalihalobacillus algicola]MCA0987497.1 iron chaperone [Alkalihalobacillus algicola]
METFEDYLNKIEHPEHRARMEEIFAWIEGKYPNLKQRIAWNEPMYTDHGTFIIAFSKAKKHMSVAPERVVIDQFADDIAEAGYDTTKELVKIKWNQPVDYGLLGKMIEFNIAEKAECTSFWRK